MVTVEKGGSTYNLYYVEHMLHHENLKNVFTNGLLSHKTVHEKGLVKQDISLMEVQSIRANRKIPVGDKIYKLHEFVPFYFNSKNPMLYRRRNIQHEIVVICVDAEIISNAQTVFSDGNAANGPTRFFQGKDNLVHVPFELTTSGSWNSEDPDIKKENVRKMCAEVLVYPSVPISLVKKIVCPNERMKTYTETLKKEIGKSVSHIDVSVQAGYFF